MRWCLVVLLGLSWGCATLGGAARELDKCVWVTRWDYGSAADIDRIMSRCADAGFSSVMFQVRGNGTALYSSHQEIWSEQFGFKAPAFDPLSQAVVSAHARDLQLHAWVNMMPGWRGEHPPSDTRQLFHTRPEWFLRAGGKAVGEGSYLWLNPCLPEVRTYLATICREIAEQYEVDGIHLDYIRFPDNEAAARAPTDARSRLLFRRAHGVDPEQDVEAFRGWKTEAVTRLVQEVRRGLGRLPRRVALTSAVAADLAKARGRLLQDWPEWARRRAVDAVFPMAYRLDEAGFERVVRSAVRAAGGVPVIIGVGAHWHASAADTSKEVEAALDNGARGVALFGYQKAVAHGVRR